jgi:toxin ParE1/3/4
MRLRARFRPLARRDLLEQILHLAEGAGAKTAALYFDAVQATCETLAIQPQAGKLFATANPRLSGPRRFPIRKPFRNYLIFYQASEEALDVIRVLHGGRDIEAILAAAYGPANRPFSEAPGFVCDIH